MAGTREPCSGSHVPAVDQHGRPAVDGERHQHLERRDRRRPPAAGPAPGRRADSVRWPSPARHCSSGADESCCGRRLVTGTGSAVSESGDLRVLPRGLGVLAELPRRQHREAQVGERDDDDEQRQPLRPQQEGSASIASSLSSLAGDSPAGELLVHPVVQPGQCGLDDGEDLLEVVVRAVVGVFDIERMRTRTRVE